MPPSGVSLISTGIYCKVRSGKAQATAATMPPPVQVFQRVSEAQGFLRLGEAEHVELWSGATWGRMGATAGHAAGCCITRVQHFPPSLPHSHFSLNFTLKVTVYVHFVKIHSLHRHAAAASGTMF